MLHCSIFLPVLSYHFTKMIVNCIKLLIVVSQLSDILAEEIHWTQSPYHLSYLANLEHYIYQGITANNSSFVKRLNAKFRPKILTWVRDYQESSNLIYEYEYSNQNGNVNWHWQFDEANFLDEDQKGLKVVGNPILCIRMVERFIVLVWEIVPALRENNPLRKLITREQKKYEFPNLNHKFAIFDNILRLCEVYELDITDEFINIEPGLKPQHVYQIGKRAMHAKLYTEAMNWLSIAHEIASHDATSSPNSSIIIELMTAVALMHDDDFNNPKHPKKYRYTHFLLNDTKMELETQRSRYIENVLKFTNSTLKLSEDELETRFDLICNGYNFQSEIYKASLYCWYESKMDAAWLIGPLKMELLDHVINLVHVYDFIGDERIKKILDIGLPRVKSSLYSFVQANRVASGVFLEDEKYPILEELSRSYESLTQLKVVNTLNEFRKGNSPPWNRNYASTPYQINAYVFGGHFGPHIDTMTIKGKSKLDPETEKYAGERMVSMIGYLNDVERGGFTAFMDIGVAALPKKGSVLIWNTLKKNGTPFCRSIHGGCPVIRGTKVIANKWIHEHENFQKRKCSLNELE